MQSYAVMVGVVNAILHDQMDEGVFVCRPISIDRCQEDMSADGYCGSRGSTGMLGEVKCSGEVIVV